MTTNIAETLNLFKDKTNIDPLLLVSLKNNISKEELAKRWDSNTFINENLDDLLKHTNAKKLFCRKTLLGDVNSVNIRIPNTDPENVAGIFGKAIGYLNKEIPIDPNYNNLKDKLGYFAPKCNKFATLYCEKRSKLTRF